MVHRADIERIKTKEFQVKGFNVSNGSVPIGRSILATAAAFHFRNNTPNAYFRVAVKCTNMRMIGRAGELAFFISGNRDGTPRPRHSGGIGRR
jgi:hypothetical protein